MLTTAISRAYIAHQCRQNIMHEKLVTQRFEGFENNFNGTNFHHHFFMSKPMTIEPPIFHV
jgi:hypothetical protein